MGMLEVDGMNMLEEHGRPSNQRLKVEVMDMVGIHMVEMEGVDMVKERLSKQRLEVEGMDMVEDMTAKVDVEVVEREHEGMVIVKHWIGDGAKRHRRMHREWELAKSGC
jgi:hypothetical protein